MGDISITESESDSRVLLYNFTQLLIIMMMIRVMRMMMIMAATSKKVRKAPTA